MFCLVIKQNEKIDVIKRNLFYKFYVLIFSFRIIATNIWGKKNIKNGIYNFSDDKFNSIADSVSRIELNKRSIGNVFKIAQN